VVFQFVYNVKLQTDVSLICVSQQNSGFELPSSKTIHQQWVSNIYVYLVFVLTWWFVFSSGDDIGRGHVPEVTYDNTGSRDNDDVYSLVLGVVLAFIVIVVVMAIAIVLVCKYYRCVLNAMILYCIPNV